MPLFDYECEKCGNIQEELVRMNDSSPEIVCTKCKNKKMKKCLSRPGMFLFAHKVPKQPTGEQTA